MLYMWERVTRIGCVGVSVSRRRGCGGHVLLVVVWFGSSGLEMVVGYLGWGLDRPKELVVVGSLEREGSSGLARGRVDVAVIVLFGVDHDVIE